MKPTICRNVIYTSADADEQWAAIITEARFHEGGAGPDAEAAYEVGLHIMPSPRSSYAHGPFDAADVAFSPEPRRGCWSWPPRV